MTSVLSELPIRLHHNAYVCADQERTRHFYEDIVGLPLVATWIEQGQSPDFPGARIRSASCPASLILASYRPVAWLPRRCGSTRQGQAPARNTGFPASRTSPELPRGGARFLR